ncbi:dTMP kinase [bacterium]|nr:dTMP kinase [bacterium]
MDKTNRWKGIFVTFEGPNGVGKSSLIDSVANQLVQFKFDIFRTKEPTLSPLGEFVKSAEENYRGRILACLVAADRYFHLENEVLPALQEDKIVLSDRYIESSLVLQRLDGLDVEFIWDINSQICIPDLSVILTASVEILKQRLSQRNSLGRFERTKSRREELNYYLETAEFLSRHGFNILLLDNGTVPLEQNVKKVIQKILILSSRRK